MFTADHMSEEEFVEICVISGAVVGVYCRTEDARVLFGLSGTSVLDTASTAIVLRGIVMLL